MAVILAKRIEEPDDDNRSTSSPIFGAKEMSRGVFWVIGDRLLSFPFYGGSCEGMATSGNTYNHKKLWPHVKPKGSADKPYNYYPRGRVDITNKGKPVIYLNPTIEETFIPQIKVDFGLREEPLIRYDHSNHYLCHFEDGWEPDN